MGVSIWPLAAFSGSAIVPIMPIDKEQFELFHQFKISEIEQMVSFSEQTGKIQFVLMRKPTDYYNLDFLEPIFKTLRPPQFIGFQVQHFAHEDILDKYYEEFRLISNSGFRRYTREHYGFTSNKLAFKTLMTNLQGNYMTIRAIANSDLSEDFAELFKTGDYKNGMNLLDILNILVLRPLRNPLRSIDAYPLEKLGNARKIGKQLVKSQDKAIPYELGRLLMKKITGYPESLDACKYIVARYEDEDIIKLFQAVNEGIAKNNPAFVEKTEKELSIALDNVWNNKDLLNRVNGIKYGVPLILGAVGTIAGSLSGNYAGLLSSLGFGVADGLFAFKGDSLSEKVSKALAPSYQTIIFDFQNKYTLNK